MFEVTTAAVNLLLIFVELLLLLDSERLKTIFFYVAINVNFYLNVFKCNLKELTTKSANSVRG